MTIETLPGDQWPAIAAAAVKHQIRQLDTPVWLVWSNQRGMWWRADHTGYTQYVEEAGRYTHAEAAKIVAQATCDGQLQRHRTDPYTGVEYIGLDEFAVLAPEASA